MLRDEYAELQARHRLTDEVTQIYRESGARPSAIESLLNRGMPPEEIVTLTRDHGGRGVDIIGGLVGRGRPPNVAIEVSALARELGLVNQVHTLVDSGNLVNVTQLRNILRTIRAGDQGVRAELVEAANRAALGNEVEIGTGADIVDVTAREALQIKEVTSPQERTAVDRMNHASGQLRGEGGEISPEGFTRIIDLRVRNPENPIFDAERPALQDFIREGLEDPVGVDRIRIQNNTGVHDFDAPDFN